mmetsp:Transcript_9175/g.22499  ORF Transcript_9175/g.22499 Transcript_9175/m.22499 type:complete len:246 (+) Transcript_9175:926-1663(+)
MQRAVDPVEPRNREIPVEPDCHGHQLVRQRLRIHDPALLDDVLFRRRFDVSHKGLLLLRARQLGARQQRSGIQFRARLHRGRNNRRRGKQLGSNGGCGCQGKQGGAAGAAQLGNDDARGRGTTSRQLKRRNQARQRLQKFLDRRGRGTHCRRRNLQRGGKRWWLQSRGSRRGRHCDSGRHRRSWVRPQDGGRRLEPELQARSERQTRGGKDIQTAWRWQMQQRRLRRELGRRGRHPYQFIFSWEI